MPLEPGSRLGPFEILSRLGAGGMGEVWKARDTRLQREVALKVLPEAFARDPDRLARFTREAHVLASLNHPNIAAIYSFEEIEGVRLLVLELVAGGTLKQRVLRGPIPVLEALRFALQIADALEAAHAKSVLHRDLKPANVNVTADGKVKLLDFGLAKAFAIGAASPDLSHSPTVDPDPTRQGVVLGTVSYMSPEQARSRPLDARSDLWSFGCLLYEMLSGRKAFDGETVSDILVAILDHEPDWSALPPGLPAPLTEVLRRLLAKDPAHRPANVGETRSFLEAAAGSRTTAVVPERALSASFVRRTRVRALALAAAVLAVAGIAFAWLAMRERPGAALPATKLLAILPAKDFTGRPDGRPLCDGVSFSLGVKLKNAFPELVVMAPSAPAMLAETDPAKWARDTGANLLVQPAVRQMGDQRQISFTLFLAGSPAQIDAGEVTGPAAEHFRLEDDLTVKLASALRLQLAGGARAATAPAVPAGPSQTDYVVALGHLERYDQGASLEKAVGLLSAIPGGNASAHVQAALGRALLYQFGLSRDAALAEKARVAVDRAVALDAQLPESREVLGLYQARTGRACDAVAELSHAVEQRPRSVESALLLGEALEDCGRWDEAEKAYRRGIDLNPRYWAGYNRLGVFYYARDRLADAESVLKDAIARNPDVARVHNSLAGALIMQGKFDDAAKAAHRATELQPEYASAWSNVGYVAYLGGRHAEAADAFRKAAALTPKAASLRANLGDALALLPGREAEARAAYDDGVRLGMEALAVNPRSARTQRVLSRCYMRTGRLAEAAHWLDEAFRTEPSSTENLFQAALLAHFRGEDAKAVDLVRRLVAAGFSPALIRNEPAFGSLLKDPSFEAALVKGPSAPINAPTP